MRKRLTAIIPCRNEQDNIRACIESLHSIADEILVADSGSTDETLNIVEAIGGCRVIHREYVHSGDFKNWAIPQASHDWVLILDADERVTLELAEEIRALLARGPQKDGYWIYRLNHFMGHPIHHGDWGADRLLRLFRKDVSRYVGETDHAEVSVSTGKVGVLRNRLKHYTTWSYDQTFTKVKRYSTWQAKQWHESGKRVKIWRMVCGPPLRFLRSYVVRLGFLDGLVGFQVCCVTAMYVFLKQARLWELQQAHRPDDLRSTDADIPLQNEPSHAYPNHLESPAA